MFFWYNTLMDQCVKVFAAAWLAFVFSLQLFAERQPYERYRSIVDRQMFGEPPLGFDPTKPPSEVGKNDARDAEAQLTKEQEQIKSAIHFSVINVTPGGETAVGFTDNGDSKNPVHYYLKVGEQRNGWLVKEADPVKATMVIAKGEVEVSLSIGGNSAKGGATTKVAAGSLATAELSPAAVSAPHVAGAKPAGGGGNALNSLRSRRREREKQRQEKEDAAEERQRQAEERQRQAEERLEEERRQREVEREELRVQLTQIQEGLRKDREERETAAREPMAEEQTEATPEEE